VTTFRAYRALLANPALTKLLAGEFVSSIGDWLYLVALLIVVYRDSADPVLLGIVGAARILPYVLLSVPAGIVADRYDRRVVLLVTDVARGVLMLGMAWFEATHGPLLAIIVLAIVATCFSAFFGPTMGSYLPVMVRDETELGPANSAWATLDNLAFIIGPAIGGLLIAAGGLTLAFLLNAASFAVIAVVLWRLPSGVGATSSDGGPESRPASEVEPASSTRGPSLRTIFRMQRLGLSGLLIIAAVGNFVYGGLAILTVVLATDVYRGGDSATGYLNAAIGVGGVLGAIASGPLVLRGRLSPFLVVGGALLGAGLAGLGVVADLAPALVAIAVAAGGNLLLEVLSTTIFQRLVPASFRGRLLGVLGTVGSLSFAGGSLIVPPLADRLGAGTALLLAGGAMVAAAAIGGLLVADAEQRAGGREPADSPLLVHVAALPLFAGVPPGRLWAALQTAKQVSVAPGTAVIRQGEPAESFYIIESGTVRVSQRDRKSGEERILRSMSADQVFGEIGLLTEQPRSATVEAVSDVSMLVLDREDFLALVAAGPGLGPRLLDLHRGVGSGWKRPRMRGPSVGNVTKKESAR